MTIRIAFFKNDEKILSVELSDKITVGGSCKSDVVLDDQLLSRRHCSIEIDENNYILIQDLNSKNGIFYKERKVALHRLFIDHKLFLGRLYLMLETESLDRLERIHFKTPDEDDFTELVPILHKK